MCRAVRAKPEAVLGKSPVPFALESLHHRLLEKSIHGNGNSKLSDPAVRLRYFYSQYWLRLVRPFQQLFPDYWPVVLKIVRHLVDRYAIHPGTTLVCLDSL